MWLQDFSVDRSLSVSTPFSDERYLLALVQAHSPVYRCFLALWRGKVAALAFVSVSHPGMWYKLILEAASSVLPRIETFARCPRVVPSAHGLEFFQNKQIQNKTKTNKK